jgi:hypothetical protein
LGEEPLSKPEPDGTWGVCDLTPIVGFVLDDRTRKYGDKVYLGVDGTVRRFEKTYWSHLEDDEDIYVEAGD